MSLFDRLLADSRLTVGYLSPSSSVNRILFWILAIIVLLNLNGVARMGFGIERAFSLVTLACSLLILVSNFKLVTVSLGKTGQLFVLLIAAYICVGIVSARATGNGPGAEAVSLSVSYLSTILIVSASTVVIWRSVLTSGSDQVLRGIFLLSFVGAVSVFFSPYLTAFYVLPPETSAFRLNGVFGNPNETGTYACMFFVLSASLTVRSGFRSYALLGLMISSAAIVLTFSRTAMITLVALSLMYFFLAPRKGAQRSVMLTAFSILALVAVGVFVVAGVGLDLSQIQRVGQVISFLQTGEFDAGAVSVRSEVWKLALAQIADSPIIGNGLSAMHEITNAPQSTQGVRLGAHNQYLVFAGESGFFVLALFLVALTSLLLTSFRCRDSFIKCYGLGTTLVLILGSITSHNLFTMRYFGFFLGLTFGLVAAGQCHTESISWQRRRSELQVGHDARASE